MKAPDGTIFRECLFKTQIRPGLKRLALLYCPAYRNPRGFGKIICVTLQFWIYSYLTVPMQFYFHKLYSVWCPIYFPKHCIFSIFPDIFSLYKNLIMLNQKDIYTHTPKAVYICSQYWVWIQYWNISNILGEKWLVITIYQIINQDDRLPGHAFI